MKKLGKYILATALIVGVANALMTPIRKVAKDISTYQSASETTLVINERASH